MGPELILIGSILIIVYGYYLYIKYKNKNRVEETKWSSAAPISAELVENDKLVLVSDIDFADLQEAVEGFCEEYNGRSFVALPRLTRLSTNKAAITFPYDIDFEIYCYFINYVIYSKELPQRVDAIGWVTTKENDNWITDRSLNKKVMLYIPEGDTDYDNVYLTTEDNLGYKLGFAMGHQKQVLDQPILAYKAPDVSFNELKGKMNIDIK